MEYKKSSFKTKENKFYLKYFPVVYRLKIFSYGLKA